MVKWGIPEKMMNMQFRRVDLRLISPPGYLSGFNIKTYSAVLCYEAGTENQFRQANKNSLSKLT